MRTVEGQVDDRHLTPVLPGSTIGILGGGQLGRMVALEARRMGYRIVTLDPVEDCPTGQVADEQVQAAYTDVDAAIEFASKCDVVLYEFEDVDDAVVAAIEARVRVPQGSALLAITRHRLREKNALAQAGIPVTRYHAVDSLPDLLAASTALGHSMIVKTTTGGYDGKGQWRIRDTDDLPAVWAELTSARPQQADGPAFIAEAIVPFERECSVVVARAANGDVECFPVAENIHRDHILHLSICPARVNASIRAQAERVAKQTATELNLVGLLGVEMFVLPSGEVVVNELAPRPHNSGHYTMDACVTSQFEQLIRVVCGLPLGSTRLLTPVVMANLLGKHLDATFEQLPNWPPDFKLHLYGKAQSRPQRKMGHVNVLAESVEDALSKVDSARIWS